MVEQMYFRPGIVIFADQVAKTIYDQLCASSLIGHIHEPLRHAIGFIYVVEDTHDGSAYRYRLASNDETGANSEKSLIDAMRLTLDSFNINNVTAAGYLVPEDKLPDIYVISHIENRYVRTIVENLKEVPHAHISYLCWCEPFKEGQKKRSRRTASSARVSTSTTELVAWAQQHSVHYVYLYRDIPKTTYDAYSQGVFDYALAQSLFALLATGITSQQQFKRIMETATNKYGTLSTSLISVQPVAPR
jgi:hypothetical protein